MEVAILAIIFGTIFGIFYLYLSTRNKERLSLIEKGADASIFGKGQQHTAPIWKVLVLNLAFLLKLKILASAPSSIKAKRSLLRDEM